MSPNPKESWIVYMGVGGYVCAYPDPQGPDGICGMPTESEPCDQHGHYRELDATAATQATP